MSQEKESKNKSSKWLIIAVVIVLLAILVGVIFWPTAETTNTNAIVNSAIQKTNQETNQPQSLEDYDGTGLTITSDDGKTFGQAYVEYLEDDDVLRVYYNAITTYVAAQNGTCGAPASDVGCGDKIRYEYAHTLTSNAKPDRYNDSSFYPVVCNKDQYPEIITESPFNFYGANSCDVDYQIGAETETFLSYGHFDVESFAHATGTFELAVFDSSESWYAVESEANSNPNSTGVQYHINVNTAISEGAEITSFTITISE